MRASTLFGVTLAVLLGLAVVVGAKVTGFLDKQAAQPKRENPIQVLVAGQNLFDGTTCQAYMTRVRNLTDEEMVHYNTNRGKYLPPIPQWADFRVLRASVAANEPLLKEHFQDLEIPKGIAKRLEPNMRAVNIVLPKDRAGAGLIQIDDRVDVYLTTTICADPRCSNPRSATAPIAKGLRVLVKRDNLWTMMAPVSDQATYILQANPYRAALLEYSKLKGILTLVPTPASIPGKNGKDPHPMRDPQDNEFKDEDQRLQAFMAGEITVGDPDLERIFRLKAVPKTQVALGEQPFVVDRIGGVSRLKPFVVENPAADGSESSAGAASSLMADGSLGYSFFSPAEASSAARKRCPTCPR